MPRRSTGAYPADWPAIPTVADGATAAHGLEAATTNATPEGVT